MINSAICLHHGAPTALHISSTTWRATGLTRPAYSSFRSSSLSLFSKASTYRTLSRYHMFSSTPIICALNKPSSPSWPNYDKDNENKTVRVVGGTSLVLACVIGVISCSYNFSPTAIAASVVKSGPVLSEPQKVLDSMLKVNRRLATPDRRISTYFKPKPQLTIPERPTQDDHDRLKNTVADLIKSGMCDEAERQLIKLYEETKKTKGSIPANDVDMELVLVLIFQGKYNEALKRDCLNDSAIPSDGRVHFYKAIIFTMQGDLKAAEQCWNEFVSSFDVTLDRNKSDYEVDNPKRPEKGR